MNILHAYGTKKCLIYHYPTSRKEQKQNSTSKSTLLPVNGSAYFQTFTNKN